jgi:DNA-binding response OmpR family regulator
MHISSLRRKLRSVLPEAASAADSIRTVRGIGYMLDTGRNPEVAGI